MANCGRPTCHICPAPPHCHKGRKCPRCKPAPAHQKTKYESDYQRVRKP